MYKQFSRLITIITIMTSLPPDTCRPVYPRCTNILLCWQNVGIDKGDIPDLATVSLPIIHYERWTWLLSQTEIKSSLYSTLTVTCVHQHCLTNVMLYTGAIKPAGRVRRASEGARGNQERQRRRQVNIIWILITWWDLKSSVTDGSPALVG